MPVGRDGDQLLPRAAPEFQYAPALLIGVGPVEVDCGPAAREHEVIQPRVRVERFTHEAPPPFRRMLPWPSDPGTGLGLCRSAGKEQRAGEVEPGSVRN